MDRSAKRPRHPRIKHGGYNFIGRHDEYYTGTAAWSHIERDDIMETCYDYDGDDDDDEEMRFCSRKGWGVSNTSAVTAIDPNCIDLLPCGILR